LQFQVSYSRPEETSIVQKKDGTLFTLMRDNGPPPKRLHKSESRDRGETWSPVTDRDLPNPGSGAEVISLRNGHWVLIYNDTERARLVRSQLLPAVSSGSPNGATNRYIDLPPRVPLRRQIRIELLTLVSQCGW